MSDDYCDDDPGLGSLGSIYNLSSDKKQPEYRGPKVNFGFQPPEKAWLRPARRRQPAKAASRKGKRK